MRGEIKARLTRCNLLHSCWDYHQQFRSQHCRSRLLRTQIREAFRFLMSPEQPYIRGRYGVSSGYMCCYSRPRECQFRHPLANSVHGSRKRCGQIVPIINSSETPKNEGRDTYGHVPHPVGICEASSTQRPPLNVWTDWIRTLFLPPVIWAVVSTRIIALPPLSTSIKLLFCYEPERAPTKGVGVSANSTLRPNPATNSPHPAG